MASSPSGPPSDSALAAFLGTPAEPGTLRVFRRSGDFRRYDLFGEDAELVAKGDYGEVQTERLRKSGEQGVPTLRLSLALFAHVGAVLLERGQRLDILAEGGKRSWATAFKPTPGHPAPLEAELRTASYRPKGPGAGGAEGLAEASILCVELRERTGAADAGFVVGAAVVNTASRTIKLFEFSDGVELLGLEAVAVSETARELLLPPLEEPAAAAAPGGGGKRRGAKASSAGGARKRPRRETGEREDGGGSEDDGDGGEATPPPAARTAVSVTAAALRDLAARCGIPATSYTPPRSQARPEGRAYEPLRELVNLAPVDAIEADDLRADPEMAAAVRTYEIATSVRFRAAYSAARSLMEHLGLPSEADAVAVDGEDDAESATKGSGGYTLSIGEQSGRLLYDAAGTASERRLLAREPLRNK